MVDLSQPLTTTLDQRLRKWRSRTRERGRGAIEIQGRVEAGFTLPALISKVENWRAGLGLILLAGSLLTQQYGGK